MQSRTSRPHFFPCKHFLSPHMPNHQYHQHRLSKQAINPSIAPFPTPGRVSNLANSQPPIDVPVQHLLDQLDIRRRHDPRDAQLVVEDLVDAVKGVFLVDEGVEEDAQGPDVLLLAAVGFALEDFGRCVI